MRDAPALLHYTPLTQQAKCFLSSSTTRVTMTEHNPPPRTQLDDSTLNVIRRKMKQFGTAKDPNRVELITLLLRHFVHNDTLNEEEYLRLRGDRFKSDFKGGNRGVVSALQYSVNPHPWMQASQYRIGDIVDVHKNTHNKITAVVTDIWKAHIRAVWHEMYATSQSRKRKRIYSQVGSSANFQMARPPNNTITQ